MGADVAARLRELTLEIYTRAEEIARDRGIILADTKVEFGFDAGHRRHHARRRGADPGFVPVLGCGHVPARAGAALLRQAVRPRLADLAESGWDRASDMPPPALPADVVARTRSRYVEAYEKLTGRTFA